MVRLRGSKTAIIHVKTSGKYSHQFSDNSHDPSVFLEVSMAAFLSVSEASKELGLSRPTLYKLVKSGAIPFYRFSPRSIRIDIEELRKAGAVKQTGSLNPE